MLRRYCISSAELERYKKKATLLSVANRDLRKAKKKRVRELFWQCWDLRKVSERTDAKMRRHILEPRLARIWIGWF